VLGGAATAPLVCRADNAFRSGIVCWNDDKGQRACGDHVPPQYAKSQREIYDNRGVVVETLKAQATPEQRAAEEQAAQDAERQQQQQQNDAFLLQTYRTVGDLEAARDNRLQSLDTRLNLAEKEVQNGQAAMSALQDRADAQRGAGKDPDPALDGQIKACAATQAENIKAVARIKQDREDTAAQYEQDIRRYQELHGAAPAPSAPAPPPPQAPKPH
jgi:hypothetical protein